MTFIKRAKASRSLQKAATALIMLLTLAMAACDNGTDCNINNVSYNRIQLYSVGESENIVDGVYSYPDTITVKLMINGRDSIVANRLVGASELQLPVSYTNECDTLVFEYSDGIDDTLYVEHSNIPYFVSTDCGMAMFHHVTGLRHTRNLIDSAAINEPLINFDWHENIKLYIVE